MTTAMTIPGKQKKRQKHNRTG